MNHLFPYSRVTAIKQTGRADKGGRSVLDHAHEQKCESAFENL